MQKLEIKNLLLSLACLGFIVIVGAAVYEQINITSKWASAPPSSLYMFQGSQGLDVSPFWKVIHPVVLLLFVAALTANWKTSERKNILVAFIGYILVLVATTIYYVPELRQITNYPYSHSVVADLQHRAKVWEALNIIRGVFIFLLALNLLLGAIKIQKRVP